MPSLYLQTTAILPVFLGIIVSLVSAQEVPRVDPEAASSRPVQTPAPHARQSATATRPAPPARPRASESLPPLVAEPTSMDFGFLPPNTPGEGTILLRNTSDAPVTIQIVQPSCKCTTMTDLIGKHIAPGATAEFQITLDGAPAMGMRRSSIKIFVEGFANPLEVVVKGEVSLPVRIVPPYINAVEQKNLTGQFIVESIDGKPFRILSSTGAPLSIQGLDAAHDQPRSSYIVGYDVTSFGEDLPSYILLETDAPGAGVVEQRVRGAKIPKKPIIGMTDTRCNIGLIPAKTSKNAVFTITNSGLAVDSVSTTSTDATIKLATTEPAKGGGLNLVITVTPRDGVTGILRVPVNLTVNGRTVPLEIIANVRP